MHIFTKFTNLRYLNSGPSLIWYSEVSFGISPPNVFTSTLLELYIRLKSFTDCLYLLDGRFNQLQIFHVKIPCIRSSRVTVINQVHYFDNII